MSRSRSHAQPVAPNCAHCDTLAKMVKGDKVYPHRRDLHHKTLWKCPKCPDAHVGCHPSTNAPLGRPANGQLRDARSKLHGQMFDPLWKTAIQSGGYNPEDEKAERAITTSARSRVYAFLANRMGLILDECHIGMFDLEQCREAWRALKGVTYPEIREWAKAQPRTE